MFVVLVFILAYNTKYAYHVKKLYQDRLTQPWPEQG
jgi:hypothetical protein